VKSRSRSAKKQRLQRLPHICHPARYERSRSIRRHNGSGKPKSMSRPFDNFCKGQGHICHLPRNSSARPRPFRAVWLCTI